MKTIPLVTATLALSVCLLSAAPAMAIEQTASRDDTASTLSKVSALSEPGALARAVNSGRREFGQLTGGNENNLTQGASLNPSDAGDADLSSPVRGAGKLSNVSLGGASDTGIGGGARGDARTVKDDQSSEPGVFSLLAIGLSLLMLTTRKRHTDKFK